MFLWRLIHNIVLSAGNLKGKGLLMEDRCCVCGLESETTFHEMFECEVSQVVWDKIYPKIKEVMDVPSMGNFWHSLF